MDNASSYITLPSQEIINHCEFLIDSIKKIRKDKEEAVITIEMSKKRWFRETFTREKAIKKLESNAFSDLWLMRNLHTNIEGRIKAIKNAAHHAKEIHLSIEDMDILYNNVACSSYEKTI